KAVDHGEKDKLPVTITQPCSYRLAITLKKIGFFASKG
ncbi:MAG: hypothetical protein ACJAUP_003820, partial [Cellvibrionaceae bacterium]